MSRATSPRPTSRVPLEHQRDLTPRTMALLAPVLTEHGIAYESWAKAEHSPALARARYAATVLLHHAGYTKAAIARAIGVDKRMPTTYLRRAGLDQEPEHPERYNYNKPQKRIRLPFAGPMQPGHGLRCDCLREADCLRGLLVEARARGMAPPAAGHCPEACPEMAPITREMRHAEAVCGVEQPMGRPW